MIFDAYVIASRRRVLTVGLNPSLHEFPADSPFRRFPGAEGAAAREPDRYLNALSAYFRADPYGSWFNAFEPLLDGMEASYYEGRPSTVLHTDICSPVATDPTWSGLDPAVQKSLERDGGPLWHSLLEALRPHIVILSVARRHLSRICFTALSDWRIAHVFRRTQAGALRKQPGQGLRAAVPDPAASRHSSYSFRRRRSRLVGWAATRSEKQVVYILEVTAPTCAFWKGSPRRATSRNRSYR